MGSNYAPTIWISEMAQKFNCHQALWLYGPDLEITEVGAMNLFAFFDHGNGNRELVTPGLENGMILPGTGLGWTGFFAARAGRGPSF